MSGQSYPQQSNKVQALSTVSVIASGRSSIEPPGVKQDGSLKPFTRAAPAPTLDLRGCLARQPGTEIEALGDAIVVVGLDIDEHARPSML